MRLSKKLVKKDPMDVKSVNQLSLQFWLVYGTIIFLIMPIYKIQMTDILPTFNVVDHILLYLEYLEVKLHPKNLLYSVKLVENMGYTLKLQVVKGLIFSVLENKIYLLSGKSLLKPGLNPVMLMEKH